METKTIIPPATGKLRQLQLTELEMLCDFRDLCEKHNLRYFLDYGNLLGAVRHGGFIPWDDDVDVTMPYEDYRKFLKIAQEEFGDKYFLQTDVTDDQYHFCFTKIRKNGTTMVDETLLGWDIHHGAWIDVFVLIETNPGLEFKFRKLMYRVCNFLLMDQYFDMFSHVFEKMVGKAVVGFMQLVYKTPRSWRKALKHGLLHRICSGRNKQGYTIAWTGITEYFPKELYETSAKLEFEGETFNVPGQYRKNLEVIYGDYMQLPPEEDRIGHGTQMIIDLQKDYTEYTKR